MIYLIIIIINLENSLKDKENQLEKLYKNPSIKIIISIKFKVIIMFKK